MGGSGLGTTPSPDPLEDRVAVTTPTSDPLERAVMPVGGCVCMQLKSAVLGLPWWCGG